jgi:predicted small secreted protein
MAADENQAGTRPGRQVVMALLIASTVLLFSACGSEDTMGGTGEPVVTTGSATTEPASGSQQNVPLPSGGAATALPPGPEIPAGSQVSTDKLVITHQGDLQPLEYAISRLGGKISSQDDRIHVYIAQFPTKDLTAIVKLRDSLRSQGFDAAVTPTLPDKITG